MVMDESLGSQRRRVAIASHLLWLTALLLMLGGCGVGSPTRASLSEEAVAKLRVAASVELISTGGHDSERTPEGPLAAIAWREYGADASWDDVVVYFEAELRDRGWESGGGSSASTQEWDAVGWNKDDRILRLSHRRNASVSDLPRSFRTIYRVTLIGQGLPSD